MASKNLFDFSGGFTIGNPNKAFETLKKESGLQLQDVEPEVVTQTNRFTAPQFAVPQDTRSLGQKVLDTGHTFLKSMSYTAYSLIEQGSQLWSATLKSKTEEKKILREEVKRLIDKDKLNFIIKNGLMYSSFPEIDSFITDQLDKISLTAKTIKNMNEDLLPDPKFGERPLSENVKDPEFWANGIGGVIPSMLSSISTAFGAALVSRGNLAVVGIATFGNAYTLEAGAAYADAINFGLSREEALEVSKWVGIINGALETILPSKLVGGATNPIKKSIANKIFHIFLVNPTLEGITELLQETWSNIVRKSYDETAGLSDNLFESFIFGFAGAGVVAGPIEAMSPSIKMGKPKLGMSIEEIAGPDKGKQLVNLKNELGSIKEAIVNHPAKALEKFSKARGGVLPEVTGSKDASIFGKRGDDILDEAGFTDDRQAQAALDELLTLRKQQKLIVAEIKNLSKAEKVTGTLETVNEIDVNKLFETAPIAMPVQKKTETTKNFAEKVKRDFNALDGSTNKNIVQDMNEMGGYSFRDTAQLQEVLAMANKVKPTKVAKISKEERAVNKAVMQVEKEQRRLLSQAERSAMADIKREGKKVMPVSPSAMLKETELTKKGIVARPEGVLLYERLRQQKKGARFGYKAGVLEERQRIVTKINQQQGIKEDIITYIKANIPLSNRGKFLTMVVQAKTEKDLVKAFIIVNTEIDNIAKKNLIKDLKKDFERIINAQNIAIDVKKRILALFKGIDMVKRTSATLASLKATKDYIERAKAQGKDVAMPERILDKLQLLAQKPAADMTLHELAALRDDLLLLERLGKTKLTARKEIYEAEKENRTERINENAIFLDIKDLDKKPIGESLKAGQVAANKFKTAYNVVNEKHLMLTPMDGIAEITGMEEMKARHDLNYSNMLEAMRTHVEERTEIIKKYDLKKNNMERAGVVALSLQEGGAEKLANLNITEKEISTIEESLTEGEREFIDFVRREFDSFYPAVKEFARVNYNVDVGYIDNWVSFQTDYEAMSDIPVYERFGELADNAIAMRRKNVPKGFIEERTGAGKQKIVVDLDRIYLRHLRNASYMLNMGRDIKMDAEIIRTPEMTKRLGTLNQLIWSEWLDLMARDGGANGGVIPMIDFMRRNTTGAILAYRLSSALLQITAVANGASEIGGTYAVEGSYKMATSREWRQFIRENFHEIMATVGDDPAFVDLGEGWFSKSTRVGITPLIKLDMMARSAIAIGAYIRYMEQNNLSIDLKNPNKEAIQASQKIVRKTQGSSLAKDQPLAITSGALTSRGLSLAKGEPTLVGNRSIDKMATALQSFILVNWNNIVSNVWRQGIKKGDYSKAAGGIFWLLIVAPLMEIGIRSLSRSIIGLITGLGDDDKERNILLELIKENIQRIPVAGPIMNSITYGSNPVPLIQLVGRGIEGAQRVATGKKLETKVRGAVDVTAGIGGPLLGIPIQFTDIIKGLLKSTGAEDLETTIGGGFDFGGDIEIGGGFDFGGKLEIGGL